jgi:hypothetical protein
LALVSGTEELEGVGLIALTLPGVVVACGRVDVEPGVEAGAEAAAGVCAGEVCGVVSTSEAKEVEVLDDVVSGIGVGATGTSGEIGTEGVGVGVAEGELLEELLAAAPEDPPTVSQISFWGPS